MNNLSDEIIKIPQKIIDFTETLINNKSIMPLSCTQECGSCMGDSSCQMCGPCGECKQQCTCTREGGQCTCNNQSNQCTCNNQSGQCTCGNQGGQGCGEDDPCANGLCHFQGGCNDQDPCLETCTESCYESTTPYPPTQSGSLTVTGTTQTTISIKFTSIPRAEYYEVACREEGSSTAYYDTVYSLTHTISGKTPNTTYLVNYRGVNEDGAGPYMSTAVRAKTKPAYTLWEWYSNIGSGPRSMKRGNKDYDSIPIIPPTEWNDFCDCINNFRVANGFSTYNFTEAVEGANATAAQFNEAVTAISAMTNSVKRLYVSRDDVVMGQSFLDIRDELNSCAT